MAKQSVLWVVEVHSEAEGWVRLNIENSRLMARAYAKSYRKHWGACRVVKYIREN
jgi:hypothetical protein